MRLILSMVLFWSIIFSVQTDNDLESNPGPLINTFRKDAENNDVYNNEDVKNIEDASEKSSSKPYNLQSEGNIDTSTQQSTDMSSGSENIKDLQNDATKDEIIKQFLLKEMKNPTVPSGDVQHDEKQKVLRHLLSNLENANEEKDSENGNSENSKLESNDTRDDSRKNQESPNNENNTSQFTSDGTRNTEDGTRTNSPTNEGEVDAVMNKTQQDLNDALPQIENEQSKTKEDSANQDGLDQSPEKGTSNINNLPTSIQQPLSSPDRFLAPIKTDNTDLPNKLDVNKQEFNDLRDLMDNRRNNVGESPIIGGLNSFNSKVEDPQLSSNTMSNNPREPVGSIDNPANEENQTNKDDRGEITKNNDNNNTKDFTNQNNREIMIIPDNVDNDNTIETSRIERTPDSDTSNFAGNENSVAQEETQGESKTEATNTEMSTQNTEPNTAGDDQKEETNENSDTTQNTPTQIAVPSNLNNGLSQMNNDLSDQEIAKVSNSLSDNISVDGIKSLSDQDFLRKLEENQKIDTDVLTRVKSDPDVMREYITTPQHVPYIDPVPLNESVDGVGDPAIPTVVNTPVGATDLLANNPFETIARTDTSNVDTRVLKSMSDAELQVALISLLATMNPAQSNLINLTPTGYGTFQTSIGDIDLNMELVPVQSTPMMRKKAKDMFKDFGKTLQNIHSKMPPGTDEVIKAVISATVPGGSEAIAVGEVVAQAVKKQREAKKKNKQNDS